MKQLSEMSKEELGTLFPIILTEHNKDWAKLYNRGKGAIRSRLKHLGLI